MDALSRLIDVADKNWSDLGFFLYGFWLDRGWSSTCNAFEFFGILNGSVDIMLDNERVTLYPGDIVFLDNNSICSCDGGSFALYHIVFFGSTDVINRELSVIFKSLAGTVMRTGDISLMNYFAFLIKKEPSEDPSLTWQPESHSYTYSSVWLGLEQ